MVEVPLSVSRRSGGYLCRRAEGGGLAQSGVMARDVQGLELWYLRTGLEAWCRAWRLLLLALLGALSLPSRGCVMLRKSLRF